ncbi:MAG: TRAP transporter small permease [Tissierellia bacterium]|nr:TRAP transporter small permease [Tissierellia bacterium]MDD4437851.1 TRAP transporter small permease [Tissierellia bacterium]
MSVIKWLDEHFEEAIMIVLLALISTVMFAQVIARNVFNSMTWPEEFSRYCYIWTVFLSLGYTIKKGNMLKVGVVMDLLPQKLRRAIGIVVNIIILAICVVFFRHSITYTGIIHTTGQVSPAMNIPMWMMYLCTILGFGLASIRTAQEIVSNIKKFNVKAETTIEATLKEAKEEVEITGIKIDDDFKNSGGDE